MTSIESRRTEELESFIFRRMGESGIIGLSIATVKEDGIDYKQGLGFRDFDKGTSVTPETIYCIGSVTKPFTALAVMQLQERGLLGLDDPVEKYVPFKARPMGEPVLVRHLLSHSSGIPSLGYAEVTLGAITGTGDTWFPICSPEDLLIYMNRAEEWALSRPGERHAYLNEGYILLGSIIERVSGVDYASYVEENILEPLGMGRSTFREEDVKNDQDVATPYVTSESGAKVPTRYPYGQMISDGGLMSSATDMARFMRALLSGGILEGVRVASAESIKDMMEPKVRTVEEPIDGASLSYYGYGLRIKSSFLGHTLLHHSGSVFGSSAYMGLLPDEGTGVVILANGGYFLEDMGEYALAILLERDPMEIPYFKRMGILDGLTGTYRTFKGASSYKVERSGGILQLTSSFGRRTFTTPLIPVDIEGETKRFVVYGVYTKTPVDFIKRGGEAFMVYERNMAKRSASE
jgi:CubicO group peptidase (beta-lactamase class C family)